MASSLSNRVNSISKGIHKIKCKFKHDDKKSETCRIKYEYCNCFLEYTNSEHGLIKYKCLCCDKNHQHKFEEKLKERSFNTYKFSNHDKFILSLKKGVYPYECMNDWQKFNELHYLKKKIFTVT